MCFDSQETAMCFNSQETAMCFNSQETAERPAVKNQLGGGVVHLPNRFGMKPYMGCESKTTCVLLCYCRLNVC